MTDDELLSEPAWCAWCGGTCRCDDDPRDYECIWCGWADCDAYEPWECKPALRARQP